MGENASIQSEECEGDSSESESLEDAGIQVEENGGRACDGDDASVEEAEEVIPSPTHSRNETQGSEITTGS